MLLAEIVELCQENGIQPVLCTIPWQGTNVYADYLRSFAEAYGCSYVNLYDHIEEMGLDEASDFSDTGHLNASGATKIARYMGAYLKANYFLTDFRTRQDNLWEQAKER